MTLNEKRAEAKRRGVKRYLLMTDSELDTAIATAAPSLELEPTPTTPEISEEIIPEITQEEPIRNSTGELERIIAAAVMPFIKTPQLDEKKVIDLIKKHSRPVEKTIVIDRQTEEKRDIGKTHKDYEKLLKIIEIGLNVYIYGEAGNGKTHLCKQLAAGLNIPFYTLSVCSQTTKSDLIGYIDANGNKIETPLTIAAKNGGLFLLDESDGGNANVLNIINAITANHTISLHGETIEKHKNFRCIMSGNTILDGASRKYIGRNALDGALKNRFVFWNLGIDQELTRELVNDDEIYTRYERMRNKINELKIETVMITPRSMMQAANMKKTGFFTDIEIDEMVIFKGCDENTKGKVRQ